MNKEEPDLSIVIASYNDREFLFQCLNSIYNNNCQYNFEIGVVDNSAYPSFSKELKNQFPDVHWIENRKNLGFIKAINQGIKTSRGKYILALNSDTILFPDFLSNIVRFMDNYKTAAAIGGKVLNPQGIVQPSCRRFPTYLTALFNRTSFLTRLFPNNRFSKRYLLSHWNHENIRRVDWVCGGHIAFKREAINSVGNLDEDYFMYCEEPDWCYRAKKKGWKIYYVPGAKLIHSRQSDSYTIKKIIRHHKSMYRFYKKHFEKPLVLQCFVASGIFLRATSSLFLYILGIPFKALHKTLKVSK